MLIASPLPAHAKGGGHGGGGHSSHSSSHHSSYHSSRPTYRRSTRRSRSSSSSSTYSSSVSGNEYILYPDASSAAANGGSFCPATLPAPGATVDVDDGWRGMRKAKVLRSRGAVQSMLYGPSADGDAQPLPAGLEDVGCTLTVQFADDGSTDTLSAAQRPESALPLLPLVLGYVGLAALPERLEGRSDGAFRRHEEKLAALEAAVTPGSVPPPSSEFWGASEETDAGDQAVRTTLRFLAGGKLEGYGRDGVDGSYRIRDGRWAPRTAAGDGGAESAERYDVAWREVYDEGFSAVCSGVYDAATGRVEASFVSDRGVRGSFTLAKKPSIF